MGRDPVCHYDHGITAGGFSHAQPLPPTLMKPGVCLNLSESERDRTAVPSTRSCAQTGVEHEGQEQRTGLWRLKRPDRSSTEERNLWDYVFLPVLASWSLPPERSRSLKAPRSSTYSPTRSRKSGSDCEDCEYQLFNSFSVFI